MSLTLNLHGADIQELLRRAQIGNADAVLALGSDGSDQARRALEQLTEMRVNSGYNSALRRAKARAGFADAQIDIASDALFGNAGRSLNAIRDLLYVSGPICNRVLMLLLDDITGAVGGGDVQYLSNAQNATFFLADVFPDGAKLPNASDLDQKSRRTWHEYLAGNTDQVKITEKQIDTWIRTTTQRPQLRDVATMAVLGQRRAYDAMRSPPLPVRSDVAVLQAALDVAYEQRSCGSDIVRRLESLDTDSRRVVFKMLAFLKLPAGISLLCQSRQLEEKRKDKDPSLLRDIDALLFIGVLDGRIVPVFSVDQRGRICEILKECTP